jgi:hypothetical protein
MMDFYAVFDQVVALLQRRSRVTYNALKLQFHLNDDQLAILKDELLYAHPQVSRTRGVACAGPVTQQRPRRQFLQNPNTRHRLSARQTTFPR